MFVCHSTYVKAEKRANVMPMKLILFGVKPIL